MYDYISLYSDTTYSKMIRTEVLEEYLLSVLKFTKDSNLKFYKEISGEIIRVTGIPANAQGNYAFDSLEGITEINLIEIDIPHCLNSDLEKTIRDIAAAIANEYSWLIEER